MITTVVYGLETVVNLGEYLAVMIEQYIKNICTASWEVKSLSEETLFEDVEDALFLFVGAPISFLVC